MSEKHVVPDFNSFPVRVTLCFKDQAERDKFMGGLSDGFGESHCDLRWEYWCDADDPYKPSRGFDEATLFTVENFDVDD